MIATFTKRAGFPSLVVIRPASFPSANSEKSTSVELDDLASVDGHDFGLGEFNIEGSRQ
jgi:hypothetical protein